MKEQEVYIKVWLYGINDLPKKDGFYETNAGILSFSKGKFELHISSYKIVTYWLKPITAIVLTPEEMKEEMAAFLDSIRGFESITRRIWHDPRSSAEIYDLYLQIKENKPTR